MIFWSMKVFKTSFFDWQAYQKENDKPNDLPLLLY